MADEPQHDDPVKATADRLERSHRREDYARTLSESALTGSVIAFAVTAAAFLAARLAWVRKRRRS